MLVQVMKNSYPREVISTANDFLEATRRCGFSKVNITQDNLPLLFPEF